MANSDNFHIGDRVRLIEEDEFTPYVIKEGDEGTVVVVCGASVGIDWGRDIGGHHCGGACPRGHGYFVGKKQIELATEISVPDVSSEELCSLLCEEVR